MQTGQGYIKNDMDAISKKVSKEIMVFLDNTLLRDVLDYSEDDQVDVILMNPPYGGHEKASGATAYSKKEMKEIPVYEPSFIEVEKKADFEAVMVADIKEDDTNLINMIEDFKKSFPL